MNVRFRGQSGHGFRIAKCPLMTQSGHSALAKYQVRFQRLAVSRLSAIKVSGLFSRPLSAPWDVASISVEFELASSRERHNRGIQV
jgi:hypothetical protein